MMMSRCVPLILLSLFFLFCWGDEQVPNPKTADEENYRPAAAEGTHTMATCDIGIDGSCKTDSLFMDGRPEIPPIIPLPYQGNDPMGIKIRNTKHRMVEYYWVNFKFNKLHTFFQIFFFFRFWQKNMF